MSGTRFRKHIRMGVAGFAAALATMAVVPALASAECAHQQTTSPFARFGDTAAYVPAPGGSFETSAAGWTLNGAAVAEGNESYEVAGGSHSLVLAPGATAISPQFCISSEYPTFRFFLRGAGAEAPGQLSVGVRYVSLLGLVNVDAGGGVAAAGGEWQPSAVMSLANALPLWLPGSSLQVGLVFQNTGRSSVRIDDVYLDPYSR